jgi:predicted enzyme related to lactoylglutathione lyase
MTKFVLGDNTATFVIGVSELNGVPTPFIAAVDPFKLGHDARSVFGMEDCNAMVERIEKAGGAVIYIHNPVGARNMHDAMATIFDHVVQGSWGDMKPVKDMKQ